MASVVVSLDPEAVANMYIGFPERGTPVVTWDNVGVVCTDINGVDQLMSKLLAARDYLAAREAAA